MGFVPVQLDKVRNFRYGMKAISLIEKKFKKPMAKVNLEDLTMEETAVMIWAGLQHEDESLTPVKVMELVDNHSNLTTVMNAAGEAMNLAFGTDEENEEEEKNA